MQYHRFMLILASIFIFACNSESTVSSNPSDSAMNEELPSVDEGSSPEDSIILFFGNSLTAGYGLDMSVAFPAVIQKKIDTLDLPYEVRNSGLSGETTTGGDSRIEFVLSTLRKPMAVFVLELGGNDGLRAIPPSASKINLQSIIDKVRDAYPQVKILLCGMEAPPNLGDEFTSQFREMYPELARKNQTVLLPFLLDKVGGEPSLNLPDGIHPTEEGHQIVAENVWAVLAPMIGV